MHPVLLYIASATLGLWGIAHLLATRGVIRGFGRLTDDNRQIITMEWIAEGVGLAAIAVFVLVTTLIDPASAVAMAVFATAIGALVALAGVSLFTGFRVRFIAFRACPFILMGSAILIVLGAWL